MGVQAYCQAFVGSTTGHNGTQPAMKAGRVGLNVTGVVAGGGLYGTGKFFQTCMKYGPSQLQHLKGIAADMVGAGQVALVAQKAFSITTEACNDLYATNMSDYSVTALANWTMAHKIEILKTIKEVIKFSLMFFFPGQASMKMVKVLVSLTIDAIEQQQDGSLLKSIWNLETPDSIKRAARQNDWSKVYQASAVVMAKAASLAASVAFTYLLVAKHVGSMSKANMKWLSTRAVQLMEFKGACMYTSGFLREADTLKEHGL